MKRSLFLFLILFLNITAIAFSQKITLKLGKVSIHTALKKISNQVGVDFFYSDSELDATRLIEVNFENTAVLEAVSTIVGKDYKVQEEGEGLILIMPTEGSEVQEDLILELITVTGVVTDENGEPLPGVNIFIKGENRGGVTNINGQYKVITEEDATLIFSFIGFITQEIPVNGRTTINVQFEPDVSELQEVVITGIVERKKESYTGAVNTISGEELKKIGNQNVIQSLKTIDPSFIVLENNQLGSNPNILPNIEVRGKSSISTSRLRNEFERDPNQPLFILDGFETELRTIVDLDMNRVRSITILKDAASTALYGSKAANGVVVVETIKPKAGELTLSYTGDFSIDTPDLSDYNLMNAEEKLRFEKLSGRWDASVFSPRNEIVLDSIYNAKLAEVRRGVDTYWLDKPLRTAFTQRHSVYVDGGDENLRFGGGVNYKDQQGVMIGSGRQTWGGNIDLTYRKNKLNITNRLYVSGFDAEESPYGNFMDYAQASPYYRPTDENGQIKKYLDQVDVIGIISYDLINPLYQSTLNSYDETKGLNLQNSLQAIYTFNPQWRLTGGIQLKKGYSDNEIFSSPLSAQFDETAPEERGRYSKNERRDFSYFGNIMLIYSEIFNEKHAVNANVRADVEETRAKSYSTVAIGFPTGVIGNPGFANSYQLNSKPQYASNIYRRNNILASVNYAYDQKYLLDATFRMDGSTAFGSNRQYSPFWSVGLGWNLHNDFNFSNRFIDHLKIRGNVGSTGNQNFGSIATTSVYGFLDQNNIFGQGLELLQLANEDLEWQKTIQWNLGFDLDLFDRRFTSSFEYFKKVSDPLVVSIDLPSSTGLFGYPLNVGLLEVEGIEAIVKYSPIYNLDNNVVWTLGATVSAYTSEYGGFNNTLESLNDEELDSQSLIRFRDGYSPDDLWAVRSLGIDPATGKEVFINAQGEPTFVHDFKDETIVGNSRPDVEGVLSSNLNYKGFYFGLNVRYRFGADLFNSVLYDKIENISYEELGFNQDARALYDRWQQPGDMAQFKAISLTGTTPISSRFVQKENLISGESISLGYRTGNKVWLDQIGLSSLRFTVFMNDIFRISTVEAERGIQYPFTRSVSFSINATF